MAATLDLGSSPERGVGSSPTESTTQYQFGTNITAGEDGFRTSTITGDATKEDRRPYVT